MVVGFFPVFPTAKGDSLLCPPFSSKQAERIFQLQVLVEVVLVVPLPVLVQFKFQIMKQLDALIP